MYMFRRLPYCLEMRKPQKAQSSLVEKWFCACHQPWLRFIYQWLPDKTQCKKRKHFFWVWVQPINSAVMVSGGHYRDSAMHIHVSILPQMPHHPVATEVLFKTVALCSFPGSGCSKLQSILVLRLIDFSALFPSGSTEVANFEQVVKTRR